MKKFISLLLCLSTATMSFFACPDDEVQTELRLNPEIEENDSAEIDYSLYPFLNIESNTIEMNGADWNALRHKFSQTLQSDSLFSVVYLGDSHIQADMGGSILRQRLSAASGYAGRGLIIPFRQAGTNQPLDYSIRFLPGAVSSRLLKMPWATEMPFTGIGIQPVNEEYSIELSSPTQFRSIRLFYRGSRPEILAVSDNEGDGIPFVFEDSTISLASSVMEARIMMRSEEATVFGGMELKNRLHGTLLHSIGNNGATYSSYGNIDYFGSGLSGLKPDIVLIALGTNEAFSGISEETMRNDIDNLVSTIHRNIPAAQIVLISPTECFRRRYRRVKGRRRYTTVVNTKVARIREVIKQYASDNGIPFYDTYSVFGGQGSATKMKTANVLGRDGVHFTSTGYRLTGSLLADAIIGILCSAPKENASF